MRSTDGHRPGRMREPPRARARRRWRRWLAAWLLLLALALLTDGITAAATQRWHRAAAPRVGAALTEVLHVLAWYGGATATAAAAGLIFLFDRRRRGRALVLVAVVALTATGTEAAKVLVARARPAVVGATRVPFRVARRGPLRALGDSRYRSFPSGHTAAAVALSVVLAAFYPGVAPLAYALATLVGFERMYDNAHFLSDVVAGALLAAAMSHWLLASRPFRRRCRTAARWAGARAGARWRAAPSRRPVGASGAPRATR